MSRRHLRLTLVLVIVAAGLHSRPARPSGDPAAGGPRQPRREQEGAGGGARQQHYGRTPDVLVPYRGSAAPYRSLYLTPPQFRGPGREEPEPPAVETVRIGLLAPLEGTPDDRAGRSLKRGVELALDEANAGGGYGGLPFELVARNDQARWGSSANTLVELAYVDQVWALIGSISSTSTHVALRAAMKAEVAIVNVGSGDPTITETGIPWIVRITPDDRQSGYRLARFLFEERGFSRVAVLRSSDRYGRLGVREFRDAARRLLRPLPLEIQFRPRQEDFSTHLERLAGAHAEAVVIWARAGEAGLIVRQMRERGMSQPVAGTDRLVCQEFLDLAGEAAEGVVATVWMDAGREQDEAWLGFRRRFRATFDTDPDALAAYGYEAARLVVGAVREAGLNRARIRDALASVRSHRGVTGTMHLDPTSNNVSPLMLARVQGGRFDVQRGAAGR